MADITKEIENFKKAVYGEDVRGSLVTLAQKVNDESTKSAAFAKDSAKEAKEAVVAANDAADRVSKQLAEGHMAVQPVKDSGGNPLTDSSGNVIEGQAVFADEAEAISLRQAVASLELLINDMAGKLKRLANHALLDDTY